ncbi:phage holin family protein [Pseudanabaena sp. FACHB-2040]|uniref:phage holin family protein n=1 Tax=Pseudanabaena sp. FACHB-2040 TaxID=2692859 RepID=UPI00168A04E0|nr:phage holin family protein [Pseudanabaena sp. FACHB-2040]MBD2258766.1 phage holin family protein [Pseudanabaena sp. FACHB-2040]
MLLYLFSILSTALALLVVDILFKGVSLANFPAAMIAAAVIGLVNSFIRPILSVLSLPINFVTLGAFSLVLNGFCFWLASLFTPGFAVHGLVAFLVGPVILSAASTFLNRYLGERELPLFKGRATSTLESSDSNI